MTNTAPASTDALLTIAEAADYLRVSRSTLYKLFSVGDLIPVKIRSRRLVRESDLAAYVGRQQGA